MVVGCAGVRSEAPRGQEQGHAEATKEQTRSPEATASEEARCEGTRRLYTTNDVPGCPKGGLLLGTDKRDWLGGQQGDDEVRGLGGSDFVDGGPGNDILYGGPGEDEVGGDEGADVIYGGDGDDSLYPGEGNDVIYGGDGNDVIRANETYGQRDKLYCGEGWDKYQAGKNDYVDSSCEKQFEGGYAA
jgi:hypothetical protein